MIARDLTLPAKDTSFGVNLLYSRRLYRLIGVPNRRKCALTGRSEAVIMQPKSIVDNNKQMRTGVRHKNWMLITTAVSCPYTSLSIREEISGLDCIPE